MGKYNQELENDAKNVGGFLAGLLLGGLAGAGAMLLLAPQSGKKTRAQIQQKGVELRDQTTDAMEDAVTQVSGKARQVTDSVHERAKELGQRGQDMIDEQKDRFSPVVEAGKTAIQGAQA
ncbi:MAG: YtxH domain-containing protein [Chloroflexi bacterium]|nr:YtxH domain-containing protein [Chloroflexota bacterium]MBU1879714.1 YtxH domain-containing protein [Chloroflexota bacterium]